MEITSNYSGYVAQNSVGTKKAETGQKMAHSAPEETTGKKYTNAAEYYDYLKAKYECLSAKNYTVILTPDCLERCVKDPEFAETIEKNLAYLPVSHQNMTSFWSAMGARVVNESWVFRGDGTCGGGPGMYVTNSPEGSDSGVRDKVTDKASDQKSILQENIEKRKKLMEQFQARQSEKKRLVEQLEEKRVEKERYRELAEDSALSREQNARRVIEKYNHNLLVEDDTQGTDWSRWSGRMEER